MTHNHLRYVYINYIALALANLVHAKRLGVAIFAIVPNSMVDEQTGSTFTWLNSHLRNRQQVKTLIRTVQIQKWYKYDPSVSVNT
jgi:hypothetical protein